MLAHGATSEVSYCRRRRLATTFRASGLADRGGARLQFLWQVGARALGTTTVFAGTIMADQTISLATGATLNGRALARIAAVTLDTNVIVKP